MTPNRFNLAFWKWFGKSAVVDGGGQPLAVYHGTKRQQIGYFSKRKAGRATGDPNAALGFFFTSSPEEAKGYGPNVVAAYLSIQNPYITTDEVIAGLDDDTINDFWEEVTDGKHDGIIAAIVDLDTQQETGERWFIAFEPTQIKSVDNLGAWDPDNRDIRRNPEDHEYVEVTMQTPSGKRRSWAEVVRRGKLVIYRCLDQEGIRTGETFVAKPGEAVERPAQMSLKYGVFEIASPDIRRNPVTNAKPDTYVPWERIRNESRLHSADYPELSWKIALSMRKHGWNGPPLVFYGYKTEKALLLTGVHRAAALDLLRQEGDSGKLNLDRVPLLLVPHKKETEHVLSIVDEWERADAIREAGYPEAADIIMLEGWH